MYYHVSMPSYPRTLMHRRICKWVHAMTITFPTSLAHQAHTFTPSFFQLHKPLSPATLSSQSIQFQSASHWHDINQGLLYKICESLPLLPHLFHYLFLFPCLFHTFTLSFFPQSYTLSLTLRPRSFSCSLIKAQHHLYWGWANYTFYASPLWIRVSAKWLNLKTS